MLAHTCDVLSIRASLSESSHRMADRTMPCSHDAVTTKHDSATVDDAETDEAASQVDSLTGTELCRQTRPDKNTRGVTDTMTDTHTNGRSFSSYFSFAVYIFCTQA